MLGIKAEIWFKFLLIVSVPPDISQVVLCAAAADETVATIKQVEKYCCYSKVKATEAVVVQSLKEIRAQVWGVSLQRQVKHCERKGAVLLL